MSIFSCFKKKRKQKYKPDPELMDYGLNVDEKDPQKFDILVKYAKL